MLLADRGYSVAANLIAEPMVLPSMAHELAQRHSSLAPPTWRVGSMDPLPSDTPEVVWILRARRGSWAALLEPRGPTLVGHWVVVDGLARDGLALIRDPVGAAYAVPVNQFEALWTHAMLVLEDPA